MTYTFSSFPDLSERGDDTLIVLNQVGDSKRFLNKVVRNIRAIFMQRDVHPNRLLAKCCIHLMIVVSLAFTLCPL